MAKKNNKPAEVTEETVAEVAQAADVVEVVPEPQGETNSVHEEETVSEPQNVGPLYKVTWPQGLNLRKDPGLEHPVLKVLPFGSVVEARGEIVAVNGSNWLPVQDGWCDAQFLEQIDNKE